MTQIPKGVGIIASLHAFSSLFLLVHVLISIPFVIATFFSDTGLGFLATFETFWDWMMVGIHASIAASLIARKSWCKNIRHCYGKYWIDLCNYQHSIWKYVCNIFINYECNCNCIHEKRPCQSMVK